MRRTDARRRAALIAAGAALAAPAWPAAASSAAPAAAPDTSTPPDTWPFTPARDRFDPAAAFDLRHLNERVAGETGFVRVDAHGDFVRGDGQPIRFWAVDTDVGRKPYVKRPLWADAPPDLAYHARFLAKRGVNMVRHHRQIHPDIEQTPNAALTDINARERDAIWRMVAAMRQEGIYSTISPYFALTTKLAPHWPIAGGADQPVFGLLFIDAQLQAAYKSWMKQLLTVKNPHTGIALADDPSVAIVQLQNEDSLFFWTVDGIRGPQREALERRFGDFVARKHGSITRALLAWRGRAMRGDAPWDGRLALAEMFQLTRPPAALGDGSGLARRLADQTEFYARTLHGFNREMVAYLRRELGVKSLINAGNWKTASAARLNDAERWTYSPGDVDAVNHYIGGVHQGRENGWAILPGDRFTSDSALRDPLLLPVNLRQTQGRPMLVTESAWVLPNAHAAEGPFMVAAYTALSGVDGFYWFAATDNDWTPPQSANGYLAPSQRKWTMGTPEMLGSFPAAALAYRRGDIRRGAPVLVESRAPEALWARAAPQLVEAPGFDPNRDDGTPAADRPRDTVPPEAYLVGPVQVRFDAAAGATRRADLSRFITAAQLRSNTGEIVLDRAAGHCTLDTPRAQGVAAHFAAAPEHRLSALQVKSANAFGAVMAVSLDDAPLANASRVLVQYATQSRPTGWVDRVATLTLDDGRQVPGREVVSVGKAPWRVVQAQLDVVLRNPKLRRVTALDMNGMPAGAVKATRTADGIRFAFPAGAMYALVD